MAVPTEEEKLAFAGIWSLVLDELSHRISIPTFQLWMETTKLAYLDANTAVVVTDRDFKRDIIEAKYFSTLCEILESIIGYSVTMYLLSSERGEPDLSTFTEPSDMTEVTEVIPGDSVHPEQVLVRQVKREPIQATPIHPNSDYTFDNYIVGESNKFAQAASYAVAKDPGNSYNPLFIYGESGLGKTHLLYSIMNEILRRFPDLSLLYVKGEEFTNELVDCLRQKTPSAFRQKYRSVDVLLIDDIQFIANKDGIQEEFFHTFNALYEDHKQIILAADRPPRDMTQLEARLRTRFEWGLLADIQPPGYELRVAILKNKAGSVGLNLPKEILAYLAGNLRSNIRQLEGAIKKIAAKAFISGSAPTLQMAKDCVAELMGNNDPPSVKAEKIIARVAEKYGVTPADIRSRKRSGDIAMARHVCIYLIKRSTDLTFKMVGKLFDRDHSTAVSSYAVVEAEIKAHPELEAELLELLKN